jgi:hypothetical protein
MLEWSSLMLRWKGAVKLMSSGNEAAGDGKESGSMEFTKGKVWWLVMTERCRTKPGAADLSFRVGSKVLGQVCRLLRDTLGG